MATFEITTVSLILGGYMDFKIETCSVSLDPVTDMNGLILHPSMDLQTVEKIGVNNYDCLIIPGGVASETPEKLIILVKEFDKTGKLLAAICGGPMILANSGIFKDRKYTASLSEEEINKYAKKGALPKDNFLADKVVRDKNVITADGFSFIDFSIEIADYLGQFNKLEEKEELRKALKGI
jgi:putative intracellular protease/amidase